MDDYSATLKWFATVILITSNFVYSLLSASFGSTLIDFTEITNTTMDKMSFSITFRFAGSCIGAAMGFAIPETMNTTVLYSFLLTSLGILSLIIGQLSKLWAVFSVQFLMGIAGGLIDVGCTMQIFQLWKDDGGPFLQAMTFMWNIASVVSPLLFEPFLSPTRPRNNGGHSLNSTQIEIGDGLNNTQIESNSPLNATLVKNDPLTGLSRIWIPLSIIGLSLVTSGLMVLSTPVYVYFKSKKMQKRKSNDIAMKDAKKTQNQTSESDNDNIRGDNVRITYQRYKLYLLSLCSILFFMYYAMVDTIVQFWLTFVVYCDLRLTKSAGSFMLSAFNVSYSISGLLGILVTAKVKPFTIILSLTSMITVGNIIHLFFANKSLPLLWIGGLIEYAGFGCFYASLFNYMQAKVGLTTRMCSILIVFSYLASGLGYTAVVGNFIESMPMVIIYNNIGCSVIIALLLFIIYKLNRFYKLNNIESNRVTRI